jgi:hypothetical protein
MKISNSLFFLILTSCGIGISKMDHEVGKCINEYAKSQKTHRGMEVMGTGGSNPNGLYKRIHVHFYCYKHLDVPEARRLFVASALEFIERMNSNEKLRPFLEEYPATIENIKIDINCFDDAGRGDLGDFVDPPYVAFMFHVGNRLIYCFDDKTEFSFSHDYEETFEEALRIVNGEQEDPCRWLEPTPRRRISSSK